MCKFLNNQQKNHVGKKLTTENSQNLDCILEPGDKIKQIVYHLIPKFQYLHERVNGFPYANSVVLTKLRRNFSLLQTEVITESHNWSKGKDYGKLNPTHKSITHHTALWNWGQNDCKSQKTRSLCDIVSPAKYSKSREATIVLCQQ